MIVVCVCACVYHVHTNLPEHGTRVIFILLLPKEVGSYHYGDVACPHLGGLRVLDQLLAECNQIPTWVGHLTVTGTIKMGVCYFRLSRFCLGSFCFTFHMACKRSLMSPILHNKRQSIDLGRGNHGEELLHPMTFLLLLPMAFLLLLPMTSCSSSP